MNSKNDIIEKTSNGYLRIAVGLLLIFILMSSDKPDKRVYQWPFSGPAQQDVGQSFQESAKDQTIESAILKLWKENDIHPRYKVLSYDGAGWGSSICLNKLPYSLYSTGTISTLKKKLSARQFYVAMRVIYLHEAVHLEGYDVVYEESGKCLRCEILADQFMGTKIRRYYDVNEKIGLSEIKEIYNLIVPEKGVPDAYKDRSERIKDVENGYQKGGEVASSKNSVLFALQNKESMSSFMEKFPSSTMLSVLEYSPLNIDSIKSPKTNGNTFSIIKNGGIFYLGIVLGEPGNQIVTIGKIIKSSDESFAYEVLDEHFFNWYISSYRRLASPDAQIGNNKIIMGYNIVANNREQRVGQIYSSTPLLPF